MILQALADYYQTLLDNGKVEAPGWGPVKISVVLHLNDEGNIIEAVNIKTEQTSGKKTVLVPQIMQLPAPVKRSSGISSNFLWDNAEYILGLNIKGKQTQTNARFKACKRLHKKLLGNLTDPAAKVLCLFFDNWHPDKAKEHPAIQGVLDDLLAGSNIVFCYKGEYLHDIAAFREAWQHHFEQEKEGDQMACLVTGKMCVPEEIHPAIKGVQGAQSSGAALVSFNGPAFCSHGKEQNLNAPVSKGAAFAYTSALNYLIADWEHTVHIGDTTVLFWAKNGDGNYQDFMNYAVFNGMPDSIKNMPEMMDSLSLGKAVEFKESLLDANMDFYILGISPNAARLSVRFFLHNTFGTFVRNAKQHQDRLTIDRPDYDTSKMLSIWVLLNETVNQTARNKSPKPILSGELIRSVLMNTRYPVTILNEFNMRILADHRMNRIRAAFLKAYYTKNTHSDVPEEVLTVSLNQNSNSIPYNLGRLFSVLETVQKSANPNLKFPIKDRYYSTSSAMPYQVFPFLLNQAEKNLRKMNDRLHIYYNKQIRELMDKLGEEYPKHLNLAQQGAFQLGYYHQTQYHYMNKEEKQIVNMEENQDV